MAVPPPPYPAPIDYADIQPGMDIETTLTWADTGQSSVTRGVVTDSDDRAVYYTSGISALTTYWALPGATATYQLMTAPGTAPEPDPGTILTDEAGAAWQRQGSSSVWQSINGDVTDWLGFLTAHPTYTLLQDQPATVLPDPPPAGYPVAIAPSDARLGMDIRVTITYAGDGGQQVTRAVCPWVQEDPPPTDETPSFLIMPALGAAQLVADPEVRDMVMATPGFSTMVSSRFAVQYDPTPVGVTLLVEQMQDWTADSVWDISGIPEPPTGSVVRSKDGVAWQRTGDATQDGPIVDGGGPWVFAGQGMWSSVAGDYPRSFLWLWGIAAPFTVQEPTP